MIGNDGQNADQVLINNGDGAFESSIDLPCSHYMFTGDIAVADMNNDGYPDIIIGNDGQKNQLLINLGNGISFTEPNVKDSQLGVKLGPICG